MVLIVVIGDLHFKKDDPSLADKVIFKLKEQIDRVQPDLIVFLGDILDTHEKIDMKMQNKAGRFFKELAAVRPVVILIGNHDRPDGTTYLTEDSCFYLLKGFPNIHIIDHVFSFKFGTEGTNDLLRFVFVPYVPPGSFHEALDTLPEKVMGDKPESRPACIFCHQEFRGARIGKTASSGGDEWPETNPLIISGHIHSFQMVGKNVIYTGTPHQISYGDQSEKGIVIAEFLPNKPPRIEFLKLGIRKKKVIELKPQEINSFVPPNDCDVKVVVQGEMSELKAIQSTGILASMRGKGIHVSLDVLSVSNPSNPEGKPYKELLLDMIKHNSEMTNIFHDIVSRVNNAPQVIEPVKVSLDELLKSAKNVAATRTVTDASAMLNDILAQGKTVPAPIQFQQFNQEVINVTPAPAMVPQNARATPTPTQANVENLLQQFNTPPPTFDINAMLAPQNMPTPIIQQDKTMILPPKETAISQTGREDVSHVLHTPHIHPPKASPFTQVQSGSPQIKETPFLIFDSAPVVTQEAPKMTPDQLIASLQNSAAEEKKKASQPSLIDSLLPKVTITSPPTTK
jgi:calcineurin-like phosphoesterase family protein